MKNGHGGNGEDAGQLNRRREPAMRYDVEDDATERASSASRAAAESKEYMEALSGLEGILEPWQRTTLAGDLVEAADLIQYLKKCATTGATQNCSRSR